MVEINWKALLRPEEYKDEYSARNKGARILRRKIKGGFLKNTPRTKQEILEIIASTGISDNPEEAFEELCRGVVISTGWTYEDYTDTKEFCLKESRGADGSVRYVVRSHSGVRW